MTILGTYFNNIGETGQSPQFIYIDTNDTVEQVTATGFLNKLVVNKIPISQSMLAVVTTRITPNASTINVGIFNITFSNGNWSLTPSTSELELPNGQIFVGNAENVATPITMSGDATISNTGALTISNGAVGLAKLGAGVAPQSIIKFSGFHSTNAGSALQSFSVPGCLTTDLSFASMSAQTPSNTAVLLGSYIPANGTLTIFYSADPGGSGGFNWMITRVAS